MLFGGYQPFSLSDYPGHIAAIAFTQGCNFRCPWCHNGALIPVYGDAQAQRLTEDAVLTSLEQRRNRLNGLVVTGGEPTIHRDLPRFLSAVKALGYDIKLDTNGSNPDVLARLLEECLVDYIAMDVKAPLDKYEKLTGIAASVRALEESIALVSWSRLPHHFRTTNVTPLLTPADMHAIKAIIPSGSKHVVQTFNADKALDPALRAPVAASA